MGRPIVTLCDNGGLPHRHATKREAVECNKLLKRRGKEGVLAKLLRDERRRLAYKESISSIQRLGGKVCAACGKLKVLSQFSKGARGEDGFPIRCTRCVMEARWGPLRPPAEAEQWRIGKLWQRVLKFYKLSPKELRKVRKDLEEASGGNCYLCGFFIPPRLRKLDHSHLTPPRIRGILCPRCNGFLGAYEGRYGKHGVDLGWERFMQWGYSIQLEFKRRLDDYLSLPVNPRSLRSKSSPAPLSIVTMAGARCDLRGALCHLPANRSPYLWKASWREPFQPRPFLPNNVNDMSE